LHRQANGHSAHCEFLPLALRLATVVAGVPLEEEGCRDRVTEWMSAGQQSNLSWWHGTFWPISFNPAVRQYRPDFEFWQCVIKERQENVIHVTLSEVSRQRAGCKCVCSGGTSSDSTTIKEAVFCNFDLAYLPCCLHPPLIFFVTKEDH